MTLHKFRESLLLRRQEETTVVNRSVFVFARDQDAILALVPGLSLITCLTYSSSIFHFSPYMDKFWTVIHLLFLDMQKL